MAAAFDEQDSFTSSSSAASHLRTNIASPRLPLSQPLQRFKQVAYTIIVSVAVHPMYFVIVGMLKAVVGMATVYRTVRWARIVRRRRRQDRCAREEGEVMRRV